MDKYKYHFFGNRIKNAKCTLVNCLLLIDLPEKNFSMLSSLRGRLIFSISCSKGDLDNSFGAKSNTTFGVKVSTSSVGLREDDGVSDGFRITLFI